MFINSFISVLTFETVFWMFFLLFRYPSSLQVVTFDLFIVGRAPIGGGSQHTARHQRRAEKVVAGELEANRPSQEKGLVQRHLPFLQKSRAGIQKAVQRIRWRAARCGWVKCNSKVPERVCVACVCTDTTSDTLQVFLVCALIRRRRKNRKIDESQTHVFAGHNFLSFLAKSCSRPEKSKFHRFFAIGGGKLHLRASWKFGSLRELLECAKGETLSIIHHTRLISEANKKRESKPRVDSRGLC